MQAKFSTIDFTERIVDLLDFSATLLDSVSSIGKIKSSMKLYTTNIQIIRITHVEMLDITRRIAIHIHTHKIYSIEFFCFFKIFSAIKGTKIQQTQIIQ